MDHLNHYRTIVKAVIRNQARFKPSYGEVEVETVFDEASDHYELCCTGWDGYQRIHGVVLHIDIRNGKVWIQHDGTEEGVAEDLVTAGIPRQQIVLGFHPPKLRKHTEYAIA
jgi:hypothetical protein